MAGMTTVGGLTASPRGARGWVPPTIVEPEDEGGMERLAALVRCGAIHTVIDTVDTIAAELVDRDPGVGAGSQARARALGDLLARRDLLGVWVHFPWSATLVRFPTRADHTWLRTLRNRDLITAGEQERLGRARIAVFGLSVGSNTVEQLVRLGIGGAYLLADPDRISATNLNRMRSTVADLGDRKTDALARRISESDPFLDLTLLHDGYTPANEVALADFRPDVVFEEVDDLSAKAHLRAWASQHRVPLLTVGDIGERSVLDVERHDLARLRPFNGKVPESSFRRMLAGDLPRSEANRVMIRLVGLRNLSSRLVRSFTEVGVTIPGVPQLSSSAGAGAALASVALRELLTTGRIRSGTYVSDPRRTLRLPHQAPPREALDALRRMRAATRR